VRDGLRICLTSDDRKTVPLMSRASVGALSLRLPAQPDGQNAAVWRTSGPSGGIADCG
jgi:hypothetical protein